MWWEIDNKNKNFLDLFKPIEVKPPKPQLPVQQDNSDSLSRRSEMNFFGNMQRGYLERALVPALSGISANRDMKDIRLAESTIKADNAYRETYTQERNAFVDPSSAVNPPKNIMEVSQRAESAYHTSLKQDGFSPLDVKGISVAKATEFLRSQANTRGEFTTLSPEVIRQRLGTDSGSEYYVRILDKRFLDTAEAKFSRPDSPHTWVATPEEIAGAKLDTYETMKRVGYSDDYINEFKADVAANRKTLSDFVLVVSEADGTNGKTTPTWDVLIDRAKVDKGFTDYHSKPESFWRDVQNLDFKTELGKFNNGDAKYLKTLSSNERDVFNARRQMNDILGVNEYFTNDGRTARTDGKNGSYGVREFLIDNTRIQDTQRSTFIELSDTGNSGLKTTNTVPEIPNNLRNFRNETRNGALMGGAFSLAASSFEAYDQIQQGDYTGALRTVSERTALGTGVGAFSAAGEQIVGNRIANSLGNSTFATNSLEKLYTNGTARNVVGRFAGTESANITSQTFNSTVRTMAGRVGGAGAIGGVVNGGFSAYDQIGAFNRGEVTGSQAIGTVTGEVVVGFGAGAAGAAAGAAIGSVIPVAGTLVGAVVGFGVGMAADWAMRQGGVDKIIAGGVTSAIDAGTELVGNVQEFGSRTAETVNNTFNEASEAVGNFADDVGDAVSGGLKSVFGW